MMSFSGCHGTEFSPFYCMTLPFPGATTPANKTRDVKFLFETKIILSNDGVGEGDFSRDLELIRISAARLIIFVLPL